MLSYKDGSPRVHSFEDSLEEKPHPNETTPHVIENTPPPVFETPTIVKEDTSPRADTPLDDEEFVVITTTPTPYDMEPPKMVDTDEISETTPVVSSSETTPTMDVEPQVEYEATPINGDAMTTPTSSDLTNDSTQTVSQESMTSQDMETKETPPTMIDQTTPIVSDEVVAMATTECVDGSFEEGTEQRHELVEQDKMESPKSESSLELSSDQNLLLEIIAVEEIDISDDNIILADSEPHPSLQSHPSDDSQTSQEPNPIDDTPTLLESPLATDVLPPEPHLMTEDIPASLEPLPPVTTDESLILQEPTDDTPTFIGPRPVEEPHPLSSDEDEDDIIDIQPRVSLHRASHFICIADEEVRRCDLIN